MSTERERILLGYPSKPIPNVDFTDVFSGPSNPKPNVDFTDVFGGPPRRSSSITELRRSRADSFDSASSWRGSGSVSGLGERPVFGGEMKGRRSRHDLKDDFYNDIFMSSGGSSPSKEKGNISNSNSRVLSPVLSLGNAFRGGETESYEKLSLPSSPTTFLPSLSNQASILQNEPKIDSHVLYRQSPLSRQVSHSFGNSSEVINSTSKSKSTNLENLAGEGQFHFSMYKWAGKGVTLIMPAKSNSQLDSRFKRLPEIIVQEVDVMIHDNMSSPSSSCKSQFSMKHTSTDTKVAVDPTSVEKNSPRKFHMEKNTSGIFKGNEDVHVTSHVSQKKDQKILQQPFNDDLNKQDFAETNKNTDQTGGKEEIFRNDSYVHTNISTKHQTAKETERTPAISLEEKVVGSKMRGKVKDFIRKFSQEGSPKRKGVAENHGRRARGKDDGNSNILDQIKSTESKSDEQPRTTQDSILADDPVPVYQNLGMAKEANFNSSFDVEMIYDFVDVKESPYPDLTPENLDAPEYNVEESHIEDVKIHLPLSHDHNEDKRSDQDELKSIDAKIRQWSSEKEGNIRSLLSTLQFVLWPESGWKPVPLVDIIEGPSVKKAYQKALLRLHPDKLQQKGATKYQKYTAEKIFDIMQEAWDQFNSTSQI